MKLMCMLLLTLFLFWGCTIAENISITERRTLEDLSNIIIDEAKEDVIRVAAASNYCEAVRHCLKRRIVVPKNIVLKSFRVDEKKWKDDVFAYGFRLKSPSETDIPHNACSVVCYFDGDKVYSIYYNLGNE